MTLVTNSVAAVGAVLGFLGFSNVWAQMYPAKPVRFIVPFAPGGGNDVMARLIGSKLAEGLGQQVIIDNRAGAGGSIGSELVAKAPPDGYTILMGHIGTLAINPALYPKLPYDPVNDFEPVVLVATAQNILVVHPSLPVHSVKDLIAMAKKRPGQLNFVSGGTGGAGHLAGELLKSMAGIDMVHVAYKGAGPALRELVGGQVHLMITNMPAAMPHVKAGRLRALAVTGASRSTLVPDLPTMHEAGVTGYELTNWFGVVAPASTPEAIVMRLNREISNSLKTPDMRDRLAALGAEGVGSSPTAFAAHIKAEITKWAKVISAAGIQNK
jgi:tripartite-type tricarboxylate transporter receptor subunit TctC